VLSPHAWPLTSVGTLGGQEESMSYSEDDPSKSEVLSRPAALPTLPMRGLNSAAADRVGDSLQIGAD